MCGARVEPVVGVGGRGGERDKVERREERNIVESGGVEGAAGIKGEDKRYGME